MINNNNNTNNNTNICCFKNQVHIKKFIDQRYKFCKLFYVYILNHSEC